MTLSCTGVLRLGVLVALAFGVSHCKTTPDEEGLGSVKEAPTGDNSPRWFGLTPIKYNAFPSQKSLSRIPWPADYWATYQGGVSHRWQHKYFEDTEDPKAEDYHSYLYDLPTAKELKAMDAEAISKLSAAEKYDLWQGRYDFKATNSITHQQRQFMLDVAARTKSNSGKDEIATWQGICNGWSLAAAYEDSPSRAVTVKNADGLAIKFYGSDIQALISQVYFDYQENVIVRRLGRLCAEESPKKDSKGRIIDPDCRDVNPMSLHMALGEYINANKPFVFDVDSKDQVWNQPVYGYNFTYSNKRALTAAYKNAAPNTSTLIDVELVLRYVVEASPSTDTIKRVSFKEYVESKTYKYTLELDKNDIIIGGEWQKKSEIPDFLWYPTEKPTPKLLPANYALNYDKVMELLKASTTSRTSN